jgi:hypothetical protein
MIRGRGEFICKLRHCKLLLKNKLGISGIEFIGLSHPFGQCRGYTIVLKVVAAKRHWTYICLFPYLPSPLPLSPCSYVYPLLTSIPSPRTTPKADDFQARWFDNFQEVDSLIVVDFLCPPSLVPQQHWMSLGHIGTGPVIRHRHHIHT